MREGTDMVRDEKTFAGKVRNRLIIICVTAIIIPLMVFGFLTYRKSVDILEDRLAISSEQSLKQINNTLSEYLTGLERQVNVLSANEMVENFGQDESREKAMGLFANTQKSGPSIMNVYLGTSDGGMHISPEQDLPDDFDPRIRPWYKGASSNGGQVFWTKPYADASSGKITITVSKEVRRDGDLVGVAAIDLNLRTFAQNISKNKVGKTGQVFVVGSNGSILAHPNSARVGKQMGQDDDEDYWKQIKADSQGSIEYTEDGEEQKLTYVTDEKTGWKMLAVVGTSELINDTSSLRRFVFWCIILGLLLAVVIAILIALNIATPINKLKESIISVSQGDLTTEVEIDRNDEFGAIGNSFNMMVENIKVLIGSVMNSTDTVYESSDTLADITEQTAASTDEVAQTIEDIAARAADQAAGVDDGVDSINHLADQIELIGSTTGKMSQLADKTNGLSNKGTEIVSLLTNKNEESNRSSKRVNNIIIEVDKNAEQISTITGTITQIAEQTNLLALNAAIEAARAGQEGEGFAVVAEEIRGLAEESAQAAKQVQQLIDGIQSKSRNAVGAMEDAKVIVEEQTEAVTETEVIFADISSAIKNLIDKVLEVNKYSRNMDQRKEKIVAMIENLAAISQETSAASEEVSAATEEQLASIEEVSSLTQNLRGLAGELQDSIETFKVKKED